MNATSIRIGAVIASRLQPVAAALTAYFADLNQAGGIYGRRVDLRIVECPDFNCAATLQHFVDRETPVALIASLSGSANVEIAALASGSRIPMIGAMAPDAPADAVLMRYAFFLCPGLFDQARALAALAVQSPAAVHGRAVVITPGDSMHRVAAAVLEECRLPAREVVVDPEHFDFDTLVENLKREGVQDVFLLAPAGIAARLRAAAQRQSWTPDFFVPASLAADFFDRQQPASGHVFLAYPVSPDADTDAARAEYRQFASAHGLPADHVAAQWTAIAQAKALSEALRRAGRDLTTEKLINALEGLADFPTGLTHAVTWGPRRRIGAMGAYIVAASPEGFVVKGWVEPDINLRHPSGEN